MNIQFNKVSNVSGELTINMEKADYQPKVEKALKNFAQQAQMPGFRKGKVPMSRLHQEQPNQYARRTYRQHEANSSGHRKAR